MNQPALNYGKHEKSCSFRPEINPESPLNLPTDLISKIFDHSDLTTCLAALCVNKLWNKAVLASAFWERICVPKALACRLWDEEFAPLIQRPCGRLRSLCISGSGITSKSLIAFSQSKAASPFLEELRFDHCYNLSGIDIVHFVEAITSRHGGPRIGYLAIEGCSQVSSDDIVRLTGRVEKLDMGTCICLRTAVLEKCGQAGCLGLCSHCSEIFKGCDLVCGSCSQPKNSHQALRARAHRWNLELIAQLRTSWKDVRHGIVN